MASILFTVLKIAGIVFLVILGLVILILLLVMFVPVRYRGEGSYYDSAFSTKLNFSWLCRIVSVWGEFQKGQERGFHIYLKIFGIVIYDNLKRANKKRKHKKGKSTKTKIEHNNEIQAAETQDVISDETANKWEAPMNKNVCLNMDAENAGSDMPKEKQNILEKIKRFFINFVKFLKNIKFTFSKVCDTIVKIKDNIKYYLEVLQLESTKQAFATCQKQFRYALRKLSPRNFQINLHLGFADPAVMGEVLAVWGMFYPIHLGNIDIQPEFDRVVMEGDFSFRGRISVFVFVRIACILFFDRNIKCLLRQLKREKT
ncbi:MAG: hypothetical protein K1W16_01820 [Lachnospiraceae bacterium]